METFLSLIHWLSWIFFLDQTFSLLKEIAPLGNQAFPEIQETEMEITGEREINYMYRPQVLKSEINVQAHIF